MDLSWGTIAAALILNIGEITKGQLVDAEAHIRHLEPPHTDKQAHAY